MLRWIQDLGRPAPDDHRTIAAWEGIIAARQIIDALDLTETDERLERVYCELMEYRAVTTRKWNSRWAHITTWLMMAPVFDSTARIIARREALERRLATKRVLPAYPQLPPGSGLTRIADRP